MDRIVGCGFRGYTISASYLLKAESSKFVDFVDSISAGRIAPGIGWRVHAGQGIVYANCCSAYSFRIPHSDFRILLGP